MQQLDHLKDIHLPEPISWWPLALGWWLSFALLIILLLTYFLIKKIKQKQQLKKQIKAELAAIEKYYNHSKNKVILAKSLSALLRRASISYYPHNNVAGLTNKDWLTWLDQHLKNTKKTSSEQLFLSETGKVLLHAPYLPKQATLNFKATQLISLCKTWLLANHETPAIIKNKRPLK